MANRRTHRTFGVIAGVSLAFALSRGQPILRRVIELIGAAVAGLLAARVPDWFEPADFPNHRKLFHGLLPNALFIIYCARRLRPCQSSLRSRADSHAEMARRAQTAGLKFWHCLLEFSCRLLSGAAAGALAGYGSHLALDFITPRSLPPIA
jgi:membrane-bound metal-dependent hydrolase YbcI (DUF457 family)